ncbi:MAG: carbon-nitrogen hydrolase family protein [Blastocatellia bacterium]
MKVALGLVMTTTAFSEDLSLTVAGLSLTPEPWNKQANLAKLEKYVRQAAGMGAQLVVTPEGFLEGYVGNQGRSPGLTREKYFSVGEEIDGPMLTRVRDLARELKIYLQVGFAERRGDKMYNSTVIFSDKGEIALHYSKTHTADDEPFNTKGTEFPVAATPWGRWGALICFDRQMPETARILALKGVRLILVPSWGSYNEMNDVMMRVRAYENGVWLAFVHPKRCLIIDPRGTIVAQNTGQDDQIVTAKIYPNTIRRFLLDQRRPELYGDILKK